jgi:hypothetical protein
MVPTTVWTLRHDRQTRALLCVWVGATLFAGVDWVLAHGLRAMDLQPSWPWPMLLSSVAGISGAVRGASLVPSDPWRVLWRPDRWWLAGTTDPAVESAGRLRPMIDLGSWMLLRFQPVQRGRARWFAVRAGTIGGNWHALRSALFWPRSETPDAGVDPVHSDGH